MDVHMIYMDVLVSGRTFQENNENLNKVFQWLRSAGLSLKPNKCKFAQLEVFYLVMWCPQKEYTPIQLNYKLFWNFQYLLMSSNYDHFEIDIIL